MYSGQFLPLLRFALFVERNHHVLWTILKEKSKLQQVMLMVNFASSTSLPEH
jgi:hypothetical protein